MNQQKLENIRPVNTKDVEWAFMNALRSSGCGFQYMFSTALCCAFILGIAQDQGYSSIEDIGLFLQDEIKDDELLLFLNERVKPYWAAISTLLGRFPVTYLQAFALFGESEDKSSSVSPSTPVSIARLAATILQIKEGMTVADLGCGGGAFLREAYSIEPNAIYYGADVSTDSIGIARMRANLLGSKASFSQEDMFALDNMQEFDRVFCDPPFGMRAKDNHLLKSAIGKTPEIADRFRANSQGWMYSVMPRKIIYRNGRAVVMMPIGSTWNSQDAEARKEYVRNGIIEAIIELPPKVYDYTSIQTVMVVLSHGHDSIRMIDASRICVQGRRSNDITEENISEIVSLLDKDSEHSRRVSSSEIEKESYVLSPSRYLNQRIELGETVALGDIAVSISRGAPLNATELDKLVSEDPMPVQYLMLKNIQNGIIDESLPYLISLEPRYERYVIKDGSIVLSKNGYPFKVAVATVKAGRTLLANGNLYVIEIDTSKANPYFVKAFLESEDGIALLKGIAVGSAIPSIGLEPLRNLPIPKVALEKQKEIADQYREQIDRIAILRRQLDKAVNDLSHVFDSSRE